MTKKTIILVCFVLLKFLLQYLLVNNEYDLHRDEYLHLDQANHLAWGYQSLPPVTSWISYIIKLLGNTIFWIKFFPALFGALTIVVVWKAIETLNGNLFALILGATCVLFSALLKLNFFYQPTSLDVLAWTTLYFVLIKYFQSENSKWLYVGSIVFAIGFLNKYDIVFLVIGLLPALLVAEQRKIFFKKSLYYSMLLAVLLILPNLIWQYNNNFPVYHHLNELAKTQLVNVSRWDFLQQQLFYSVGSLLVFAAALYALLFYEPFKKYQFLFWSIIFTLLLFVYLRAKGYYALGLYPIYITFGSVFLGNILNSGWKKHLKLITIAVPVLFYLLLFNVFFTNKSPDYVIKNERVFKSLGLLRWEDGKDHLLPQDVADMLGWQELAQKVDSVYHTLPDKNQTLILCDNYGQAGAINYYTSNKGLKAVSFNADYVNWFNLNTKIENFIRVKEFKGSENELAETAPFFATAYAADSVTNSSAREYKTKIFVFTKPNIDINLRLKAEVERKKHFR
jgi:hypothetical protein